MLICAISSYSPIVLRWSTQFDVMYCCKNILKHFATLLLAGVLAGRPEPSHAQIIYRRYRHRQRGVGTGKGDYGVGGPRDRIGSTSVCHILSPFLNLIHCHRSTQTCINDIACAGLSCPIAAAGAYQRHVSLPTETS